MRGDFCNIVPDVQDSVEASAELGFGCIHALGYFYYGV